LSVQNSLLWFRDRVLSHRWVQIAIFVSVLVLSFLLFWLGRDRLGAEDFLRHGYLGVFVVNLLTCASILFPVPGEAVNVAGGASLNPFSVALVATIGATIGEMTAYLAGILGRSVFLRGYSDKYVNAQGWMDRHGALAVFLFALIPMLLYDLIGIVAGATRYNLPKFIAATFGGRFLRCLIEALLGFSLLSLIPIPWLG